jgi:hypothetical protein
MSHHAVTPEQITAWFAGRLPDDWYDGPVDVTVDRDEILVLGRLPAPDLGDDATAEERRAAAEARIDRHREETRGRRIKIAEDAEARFDTKVSWGAACDDLTAVFTHLSIPAMTRLRIHERQVLDTLVDSGVARSRSDALAWCVRLVARNQDEWLQGLREALSHVEKARRSGPA